MRTKFFMLTLILGLTCNLYARHKAEYYNQWAERIAKSEMQHNPELWMADGVKKPKWDYTQTLVAKALLNVYQQTRDTAILRYVQDFADYFINSDGTIKTYKISDYNIDRVNGGNFIYTLYDINPQQHYLDAIQFSYSQLLTQPRVSEGGFWHKKIYPYQMWLDGLYMAEPFYAHYAAVNNKPELFDDIAKQFIVVDKHTLDTETGLNYHGWDEAKEQIWADSITGCSPNFWSRSIGWYVMAIVDVLDYMPQNHPQRQQLIDILNRECKALLKYQDKKTKMWYQLTTLTKTKGNYLESTGTIMFCYAMAKGARMGYLPKSYLRQARKIFDGIIDNSTQVNADGTTSITRCCAVAGLGGKQQRNGTVEYYLSEPIRNDDPKAIGPFIFAAYELARSAK
ncbi:MAG: glycoside hydrolase family 88 protein [Paludibacteraceae bacterium]|nr:glycoside hydrolase family 88 protein [Paludibacteraceae bacterium]